MHNKENQCNVIEMVTLKLLYKIFWVYFLFSTFCFTHSWSDLLLPYDCFWDIGNSSSVSTSSKAGSRTTQTLSCWLNSGTLSLDLLILHVSETTTYICRTNLLQHRSLVARRTRTCTPVAKDQPLYRLRHIGYLEVDTLYFPFETFFLLQIKAKPSKANQSKAKQCKPWQCIATPNINTILQV